MTVATIHRLALHHTAPHHIPSRRLTLYYISRDVIMVSRRLQSLQQSAHAQSVALNTGGGGGGSEDVQRWQLDSDCSDDEDGEICVVDEKSDSEVAGRSPEVRHESAQEDPMGVATTCAEEPMESESVERLANQGKGTLALHYSTALKADVCHLH